MMENVIMQRKAQMKEPGYVDRGDLLSAILQDDLFNDNPRTAVDECFTIFFAGSQTVSITTSNLLMYLIQNPEYMTKVKEEFKRVIADPFR